MEKKRINNPMFSVIIPTFNRQDFLKQTIQSVLGQTFSDYEIIVIDDHSEDNTRDVVHSFRDKRIKYLKNHRTKGANGARNTGIFNATGRWIAFLDDDDVWLPDMLASMYRKIEGNGEYGLIYTAYAQRDFQRNTDREVRKPKKEGDIYQDFLYENFMGFSFIAVQKELAIAVNGMDEAFPAIQDWDFLIRVVKNTKVGYIDEVLGYYRKDGEESTTRDNAKKKLGTLMFLRKHKDEIKNHPSSYYRMTFRIAYFACLSKDWKTFIVYAPKTLLAINKDRHNILFLLKKIMRYYSKLLLPEKIVLFIKRKKLNRQRKDIYATTKSSSRDRL